MKNKKYIKIVIPVVLIICFILIGLAMYFKELKKSENKEEVSQVEPNEEIIQNSYDNTMVIEITENLVNTEKSNDSKDKEKKKPKTKTAAELTQEIYAINGPVGKIEIPSTKVNLTILSNVTVNNMEKSPCFLYTTGGINKKGTTLIVGHNKRNGKLFSNNAKIKKGDKIYITDLNKKKLEYTVYNKVVTTDDDTSYLKSDVKSPEIVLSSCTDDESKRIIIQARAKN
ncbi:MAG: sortase [Clostridia bacterium]|nr:sortase [Clostridia bacterium]